MKENEPVNRLNWREIIEGLNPQVFEEESSLKMPYFPPESIKRETNLVRRQEMIEANYWWARSQGIEKREKYSHLGNFDLVFKTAYGLPIYFSAAPKGEFFCLGLGAILGKHSSFKITPQAISRELGIKGYNGDNSLLESGEILGVWGYADNQPQNRCITVYPEVKDKTVSWLKQPIVGKKWIVAAPNPYQRNNFNQYAQALRDRLVFFIYEIGRLAGGITEVVGNFELDFFPHELAPAGYTQIEYWQGKEGQFKEKGGIVVSAKKNLAQLILYSHSRKRPYKTIRRFSFDSQMDKETFCWLSPTAIFFF